MPGPVEQVERAVLGRRVELELETQPIGARDTDVVGAGHRAVDQEAVALRRLVEGCIARHRGRHVHVDDFTPAIERADLLGLDLTVDHRVDDAFGEAVDELVGAE